MTKEEIIKKIIPNGVVNVKGKGDGKPQYKAEIAAIEQCMSEYASQCTAPLEARIRELEDMVAKFAESAPSDKDVQYGTAKEADFEEGTWTFIMDKPYFVMGGRFKIVPVPLPKPPKTI